MERLGERIFNRRKKQGLSQEELAAKVGVSRQTVSKWETNTMQPTLDNIKALSEVLEVDVNYFFSDEVCLSETEQEPTGNEEETVPSVPSEETLSLRDEEKKELRLQKWKYINKIIGLSFLTALSAFATFVIGMCIPKVKPGAVVITTTGLDLEHFFIALIITIILLILDIQLIVFYNIKFHKKKK